jgi:cation:H+ antiporter
MPMKTFRCPFSSVMAGLVGRYSSDLARDCGGVSDPALGVVFVLAAAISLLASWRLVTSLERVGARLELSEALLGMLAALAADAPEITAAVTALVHHDGAVGAGVVIGSNVFNLAALIGLSAVVAGSIALHRRVIELAGAVALWIAGVSLAVVGGLCSAPVGLVLVLFVLAPYCVILGVRHERLTGLRLPRPWTSWLVAAISEEELELEVAIHPSRGHARDALLALGAVSVVVVASIAMERAASELGSRHAVPGIVTGALVLAAVTSLPNAVAAVYLARRGRGAAVLSTALNSNAFNTLAGFLIPTTILGLDKPSGQTIFVTASYVAMTVLALAFAYRGRGLRRPAGLVILGVYGAFVAVLLASSN